MLSAVLTVKAPEAALTVADAWAAAAELEAVRVRDPGVLGVKDRAAGDAVTPAGSPVTVTETEPVKPLCPATETWIVWTSPGVRVMATVESETVKLGGGGGGGGGFVPPLPPPLLLVFPPPQPIRIAHKIPKAVGRGGLTRMAISKIVPL